MKPIKVMPKNLERYGEAYQLPDSIDDDFKAFLKRHYSYLSSEPYYENKYNIICGNTNHCGLCPGEWIVIANHELWRCKTYDAILKLFNLYDESVYDQLNCAKLELRTLKLEKVLDQLHTKYNFKWEDLTLEDFTELQNNISEIVNIMKTQ